MQPSPVLETHGLSRDQRSPQSSWHASKEDSTPHKLKREFCMTEQDYMLCNPAKTQKGNTSPPLWLCRFPPHNMEFTLMWKSGETSLIVTDLRKPDMTSWGCFAMVPLNDMDAQKKHGFRTPQWFRRANLLHVTLPLFPASAVIHGHLSISSSLGWKASPLLRAWKSLRQEAETIQT